MTKSFKKVKLGLLGVGFCVAGALASPGYSAVEQEQVVPQTRLEQVTTIEQAETLYQERLNEYSADKKLDSGELKSLYGIQLTRKDLLKKQREPLAKNYDKAAGIEIKSLDSKIKGCKGRLTSKEKISVFAKTRERLDEKILVHYPFLVDENEGNVVYPARGMLEPELNAVFKGIVVEADKILRQYYQDNRLGLILKKNEFCFNNVISLYNLIKDQDDDYFDNSYEADLKEKISILEGKKSRILNLEQNLALKNRLSYFDKEIRETSRFTKRCKDYFDQKENVKNFEDKYGNFNNQFSIGVITRDILAIKKLKGKRSTFGLTLASERFERDNDKIISGLEACIGSEGLSVEGLENPAKTKLPFWLGTLLLGLGFPIARNLIIKRYVKGTDTDVDEYVLSGISGLTNGFAGFMLIDGLHPLIYPARMLTPLVMQPLFKILKTDPCNW